MDITNAIFHLLAVIAISVLLSVLAMLTIKLTAIDLKDIRQRNKPLVLIIAGIFNLLFILAVKCLLLFWDHQPLSVLGFSFHIPDIWFVLTGLVLSIGLSLGYVWMLNKYKVISITRVKNYFSQVESLPVMFLVFLVLFIAALQEEILFRGYFAYILLPSGFFYALIISATIFTLWHFLTNKVNMFQAIDWFLGGIMLFCIYWLSGSVWVAAIIHFSRNLTNVIVFGIAGTNSVISFERPIQPRYKTYYTIIYTVIIILWGLVYY